MHDAYRIMIAQGDSVLASLLTRLILRRYPTAVVPMFCNGLDALAVYDQTGADLLFVNHRMPGMDGPTLIRTVRARGDMVPIIGMSGDPSLREVYRNAGATVFAESGAVIEQLSALLQCFLPATPRKVGAARERTVAELYPPEVSSV